MGTDLSLRRLSVCLAGEELSETFNARWGGSERGKARKSEAGLGGGFKNQEEKSGFGCSVSTTERG